jgi:hypothetical protein
MSLDEMVLAAASQIVILSRWKNVGTPDTSINEPGVALLTYPDGQVFEVRVTMLHGIDKEPR